MKSMTTKERFARMFEHREADRIPIIDVPWQGTLSRWRREGMPADVDWRDFFDVDKTEHIGVNNTPRYEVRTLEETEDYRIYTSAWGVTMKEWKHEDSTPAFLDFTIRDAQAWLAAKQRMGPDPERIHWQMLADHYPLWQAEGRWLSGVFWFGFDVTHSWVTGTETLLIAMAEEPEWVHDMFETMLSQNIALFEMILKAGYQLDEIFWYDDMGYKGTPFFSNAMYRELLQPYHRRAVEWAHAHGLYAHLHSCGDIMPLLPDIMATGLDALNPLEVKAGMDPAWIKQTYGDRLVLHGGINAVLWDDRDAILAEIDRIVPILKQNGGYIFSSDHSIPNTVTLENFRQIVARVKQVGAY